MICEGCGWLNGQGLEPQDMRWFFAKGQVTVSESGCYEWGARRQSADYGWVWSVEHKRTMLAHRWAWELANDAEIPKGMVVMHQCDNPPCVNPTHLEVGTYSQNTRDAFARGLVRGRARVHCPSGHAYTEDNIYRRANGERMCKTCVSARDKKKRERNRVTS